MNIDVSLYTQPAKRWVEVGESELIKYDSAGCCPDCGPSRTRVPYEQWINTGYNNRVRLWSELI